MVMLPPDSSLSRDLRRLADDARIVFFTGLPSMGKSLMIQQLAHLAGSAGRTIHLLQWDVARPVFEASRAAAPYPIVDGVTHGVIRKAVGFWVRHAIVAWDRAHPERDHLLIGETPFIGGRLIELARPASDAAEALLHHPACVFAIPVPSREVRQHLERERTRRASRPQHEREREDAPPDLMRELWRELVGVAQALGVVATALPSGIDVPYDPTIYQHVYESVLKHRRVEVIAVDAVLPTDRVSAYDFAVAHDDVVPSAEDAERSIHEVETQYPELANLARELARWYVV